MKKIFIILAVLYFFLLREMDVLAICKGTYICADYDIATGLCDTSVQAGGVRTCNASTQNACSGLAGDDCSGGCVYNDKCCWPSCPSSYCGTASDGCGGSCTCRECGPDRVYTSGSCGPYVDYFSCKASEPGCTECEDCSPACGQAKDCGGYCSDAADGNPVAPAIVSPTGTITDPALAILPITLTWNAVSLADRYSVLITNLDTGATLWQNNIIGTSTTVPSLALGNTFTWQVRGVNVTCGTDTGTWSVLSYFMTDYVPTIDEIILYNQEGQEIYPDSSGRNNICQEDFVYSANSRQVRVVVLLRDEDVAPDYITGAQLRWNGRIYPLALTGPVGNVWTGTVTIDYAIGDNSSGTYNWEVEASDIYVSSGWIDSLRAWKVWDCQVPVLGTLYDGSAGQACNATGFTVVADSKLEFSNLIYKDMSGSDDVNMALSLPANYGVSNVYYGKNYLPIFNDGDISDPDGTIMGTGRFARIIDLGVGITNCPNNSQFNLEDKISAYVTNPSAKVDFSFIRDQEGWFQVSGAGVKAKSEVNSGVPVTVDIASRALSISGIRADNGLISYSTFTNINGYNDDSAYGIPNDWWIDRNTNDGAIYSYQYFYNNFLINAGIGVTGTDWDVKPSSGVYFVNGDLNINSDFSLSSGETMIVVVKGKITIENTVNRIDGIYIADDGIEAMGDSANQLVVNGMLFSRSNVRLGRSYTDKGLNNTSPPVLVNYQTDLIFNMPGKLMRVLSGWREE